MLLLLFPTFQQPARAHVPGFMLSPASRALTEPLSALAGSVTGGPGPLEIIATQLAGHIYNLSDEVKAGNDLGLHSL